MSRQHDSCPQPETHVKGCSDVPFRRVCGLWSGGGWLGLVPAWAPGCVPAPGIPWLEPGLPFCADPGESSLLFDVLEQKHTGQDRPWTQANAAPACGSQSHVLRWASSWSAPRPSEMLRERGLALLGLWGPAFHSYLHTPGASSLSTPLPSVCQETTSIPTLSCGHGSPLSSLTSTPQPRAGEGSGTQPGCQSQQPPTRSAPTYGQFKSQPPRPGLGGSGPMVRRVSGVP